MKRLRNSVAIVAMAALIGAQVPAFAQEHHDDHGHGGPGPGAHGPGPGGGYVHHQDWRRGSHIGRGDWDRGQRVDYRSHHLRAPPRGYEWREVDGNYVLAAVATGVIASILLANH